MQFQVPQFIETEDKIIGPFSIKEFMYIGAGAGISFFLFFIVNTAFWFIISTLSIGSGLALAFVKINGRPLASVMVSAFEYYLQPQIYVWQPEHPNLEKNEETLEPFAGRRALETIMGGLSLKSAWHNLQTGTAIAQKHSPWELEERFEILHRQSGEQRAARRIDYR